MPPARDSLQALVNRPPETISVVSKRYALRGIRSSDGTRQALRIDAVRHGDEEALRELIQEFSPLVFGVALSITRNEADASDVVQDVFVGLPEALQRFDGRRFAGWLKVVASRRALMLLRSEKRRTKNTATAGQMSCGSLEDQTLTRIMLEQALDRLAPSLRHVFMLKEVEGLSHGEIAAAMGISENLSQVRLHRARRNLRSILT